MVQGLFSRKEAGPVLVLLESPGIFVWAMVVISFRTVCIDRIHPVCDSGLFLDDQLWAKTFDEPLTRPGPPYREGARYGIHAAVRHARGAPSEPRGWTHIWGGRSPSEQGKAPTAY